MINVPEQYVVNVLYENVYKISYNKYNKTYNTRLFRCEAGIIDSISKEMYRRLVSPFYILIVFVAFDLYIQ